MLSLALISAFLKEWEADKDCKFQIHRFNYIVIGVLLYLMVIALSEKYLSSEQVHLTSVSLLFLTCILVGIIVEVNDLEDLKYTPLFGAIIYLVMMGVSGRNVYNTKSFNPQ